MIRRPPRSTRTATRLPYPPLFRSLIARPAIDVQDLLRLVGIAPPVERHHRHLLRDRVPRRAAFAQSLREPLLLRLAQHLRIFVEHPGAGGLETVAARLVAAILPRVEQLHRRSEEHTSELQSLMRSSYAVFCLKKKNINLL